VADGGGYAVTIRGWGHVVELVSWSLVEMPIQGRIVVALATGEKAWENAARGLPTAYHSSYYGKVYRAREYLPGHVLACEEDRPTFGRKVGTRVVLRVDGLDRVVIVEGRESLRRLQTLAQDVLIEFCPYRRTA